MQFYFETWSASIIGWCRRWYIAHQLFCRKFSFWIIECHGENQIWRKKLVFVEWRRSLWSSGNKKRAAQKTGIQLSKQTNKLLRIHFAICVVCLLRNRIYDDSIDTIQPNSLMPNASGIHKRTTTTKKSLQHFLPEKGKNNGDSIYDRTRMLQTTQNYKLKLKLRMEWTKKKSDQEKLPATPIAILYTNKISTKNIAENKKNNQHLAWLCQCMYKYIYLFELCFDVFCSFMSLQCVLLCRCTVYLSSHYFQ